ncbi:phospholipase A1 PLIP1, chloroplastic [Musa acuminata AAA Group]|uniref:phospholipase A1 PLIP1, chloroplastic n=1 Tax=Musa acuminata AAA Group TaxID=214697 RepID=UPI0031D004E5
MVACAAVSVPGSSPAAATVRDHLREGMRRSRSAPQLRCSLAVTRAAAPASLKSSRSIGVFPFGSIVTNSIRSFLFEEEEEEAGGGMRVEPADDSDEEAVSGLDDEDRIRQEERANWVARISELRRRWRDRQHKHEEEGAEEEDGYCGVSYDTDEEEGGQRDEWDRESFARLLGRVPWSEAELFSQLAYLCYMAYVIPEIKAAELWEESELGFVTSSLEKKSQAAIRAQHESDPRAAPGFATSTGAQPNHSCRPSLAYEIAASAASYIHSRAKGLLSLGSGAGHHDADAAAAAASASASGPYRCGYKNPQVAAYVAASTMTAVVAAEEEARQEAAKDLRSLHSSPCEWFVCDHDSTCTRCFVIQGSDSLASWQANLFFEPIKFEEMEVLVHRGIYEAAKGIYEQFLPEIKEHLSRHGDRARLRFTGHSLGGSLCLLVGLMLLARGDVRLRQLLPVVTFGSPSVFCGGQRVLEELGLDEGFVRSVMMHRDIVPRAFSCNYPNHVAHVLKRLNAAFRSHPCLNNQKVLYSPLGQIYILQPDDKSSPFHPLLPPEAALYALDGKNDAGGSSPRGTTASALRAFINSPHPLETLSDPRAYGSEGTILRDHDCRNYVKAINGLLRQHTKSARRRSRKHPRNRWWPRLPVPANGALPAHSCAAHHNPLLEKPALLTDNVAAGL